MIPAPAKILTQGWRVIRFIEAYCVFTNGRWTGLPFKLLDWQKRLILELFEIDPATGLRRYRRALIGVGRKNGKTELAAALSLYFLLDDGEASAEIYHAAASEDQADRVFGASKRMVELSPALGSLVTIWNKELVSNADPYSKIIKLTAKGSTKHGLNVHVSILDELHAWEADSHEELWAALSTGMAAREQPMQIAITTAGIDIDNSRCGDLYELGKRIQSGEVEDRGFFFRWWEAPEGCDWKDPESWRLANPSYGETIDEGFYQGELLLPEATFRRLYLNQWVEAADFWLPSGVWDACKVEEVKLSKRADTYIGWDASTKHDTTAIYLMQKFGRKVRVTGRVWFPPVDARGHPLEDWRLPIAECEEYIRWCCKTYNVKGVAYDPAFITWSADSLEVEGLPMVEWPQTSVRMCPATQAAYDAIMEGRLEHDGDLTLGRHIRASRPVQTRDGGQRLTKRRRGVPIDAAIAMTMAIGLSTWGKEKEETPNPYSRRGIQSI